MGNETNRTEISSIGEFGLIDRISKHFSTKHKSSMVGIGDDAAVIMAGEQCQLLTTDMLVEGIHFDLTYSPLQHLGYKAVAVNVSDIAAMNGVPEQIIVSMGLSNRFSVEAVDVLYEGIRFACDDYNVDLVGGDTTSSRSGLILSVTAIGNVPPKALALRSTAQKNDIVCVTGDLGAAYLGLQVLEREKQEFLENPSMQPKLEKYDYLVRRQLKPGARTDIIHELRELQVVPTAMIDISDGLASDIMHICKESEVGVNIYEDKIPIDQRAYDTALEFKLDPMTCALNGGEDYELLFTIRQEDFKNLENHPDIHFIGYIYEKEKGINLITRGEKVVPIQAQGWQHFKL